MKENVKNGFIAWSYDSNRWYREHVFVIKFDLIFFHFQIQIEIPIKSAV